MNASDRPSASRCWPDYRAVWRWHFYAGLFCIPFVVVLATSGSIYLFKTEIESWIDRPYDRLEVSGQAASAADQLRAALVAVPDSTFDAYELPEAADSAVRVVVRRDGEATRVYLHPESLDVLKKVAEDDRFMRPVSAPRRVAHGQPWLGGRRTGRLVDDRHDRHRPFPLVAARRERPAGCSVSPARRRFARVLARHPRRHGLLDLRARPLDAVQRPALGEVLG